MPLSSIYTIFNKSDGIKKNYGSNLSGCVFVVFQNEHFYSSIMAMISYSLGNEDGVCLVLDA